MGDAKRRQNLEVLSLFLGNGSGHLGIDQSVPQDAAFDAEFLGQRLNQGGGGDRPDVKKGGADPAARRLLTGKRVGKLFLGDQPVADKLIAQSHRVVCGKAGHIGAPSIVKSEYRTPPPLLPTKLLAEQWPTPLLSAGSPSG